MTQRTYSEEELSALYEDLAEPTQHISNVSDTHSELQASDAVLAAYASAGDVGGFELCMNNVLSGRSLGSGSSCTSLTFLFTQRPASDRNTAGLAYQSAPRQLGGHLQNFRDRCSFSDTRTRDSAPIRGVWPPCANQVIHSGHMHPFQRADFSIVQPWAWPFRCALPGLGSVRAHALRRSSHP